MPILVGETSDSSSLIELAKKATVLLSTAGPYRSCGTPIVLACIEAGTHYADITGELPELLYSQKAQAGQLTAELSQVFSYKSKLDLCLFVLCNIWTYLA